MAFRLKFSARALREIGEAQEWYELQNPGLGQETRAGNPHLPQRRICTASDRGIAGRTERGLAGAGIPRYG